MSQLKNSFEIIPVSHIVCIATTSCIWFPNILHLYVLFVFQGKLYYIPVVAKPEKRVDKHFFCIDKDLIYWNFFLDFGPLNLGMSFICQQHLRCYVLCDQVNAQTEVFECNVMSCCAFVVSYLDVFFFILFFCSTQDTFIATASSSTTSSQIPSSTPRLFITSLETIHTKELMQLSLYALGKYCTW